MLPRALSLIVDCPCMQAIGMCPKEKLFKGYVQLERDLGEIDRCRKVYRRVLST